MRKILLKILPFVLAMGTAFSACDGGSEKPKHEHVFDKEIRSGEYLKEAATCLNPNVYYYACECGEHGEETYSWGGTLSHSYQEKTVKAEALKAAATCSSAAKYLHSCSMCGKVGGSIFLYGDPDPDNHDFSKQSTAAQYLKSEPTETDAAKYYYSCADCGAKGEETFSYGEPLRQYSPEEKIPFTPISLTVTLYDAENSVYGFTYHTAQKPLRPVLQIAEGESLEGEIQTFDGEVTAETTQGKSADNKNATNKIFVVKIKAQLKANTKYAYRVYDKYVQTGSEVATITTKDTKATKFTFAHLSDSQAASGDCFRSVLAEISGTADFVVHTGDVVQYAMYEYEWDEMLHKSFSYLSALPMMAVSGNHEVPIYGDSRATIRHFHYDLAPSCDGGTGVYYTFVYGNTRFIMLNTNDRSGDKLSSAQLGWLESVLKKNDSFWTVVAMHNPLYSVGEWGSKPGKTAVTLALQGQLRKLFYEYGVDIVLQGHDHCVSKTYPLNASGSPDKVFSTTVIGGVTYAQNPDGVYYLMNGPAGDQNRNPYLTEIPAVYEYARGGNRRSWAEFAVDGNTLTVQVKYYENGVKTYYSWGVVKS